MIFYFFLYTILDIFVSLSLLSSQTCTRFLLSSINPRSIVLYLLLAINALQSFRLNFKWNLSPVSPANQHFKLVLHSSVLLHLVSNVLQTCSHAFDIHLTITKIHIHVVHIFWSPRYINAFGYLLWKYRFVWLCH